MRNRMKKDLVYNYFSDDDFLRISNKIGEMEKITSGEIRVSIKEKLSLLKSKKDLRQLAEEEFFKLGMDKTRDKTGILIYIVLEKKKFFILADSGINEKVDPSTWENVKDEMLQFFLKGDFAKGVITGIEKVGNILSKHFPIKSDDTNELSNKVVL